MKPKILIVTLIVLFCLALALPEPVQATKPVEDFEISATLTIMSETYAEGDFQISCPDLSISDQGFSSETFKISWDGLTIHGVKTLEGDMGTIVVKFRGRMTPEGVEGMFTIVSGTGAYAKLHAVGTTTATIWQGVIDAHYIGSAHFD
jgi:hypothetical protein